MYFILMLCIVVKLVSLGRSDNTGVRSEIYRVFLRLVYLVPVLSPIEHVLLIFSVCCQPTSLGTVVWLLAVVIKFSNTELLFFLCHCELH